MPAYRLYFLGDDGHIVRALELDCKHDRQAISQAEHHADGRAMELWEGARMIQVFGAPAERHLAGRSAPFALTVSSPRPGEAG